MRYIMHSMNNNQIANFKRAIDYLEDNVTDSNFEIAYYRNNLSISHVCDTVGCAIGHFTALLTPEEFENCKVTWKFQNIVESRIKFYMISEVLFGIEEGSIAFEYLFSSKWSDTEENTRHHVIERMKSFLIDGYPKRFMIGDIQYDHGLL